MTQSASPTKSDLCNNNRSCQTHYKDCVLRECLNNIIKSRYTLDACWAATAIGTPFTWWCHQIKTFPRYWPFVRPVTRCFDVFFDLRLNKRFIETPVSWEARAHYNVNVMIVHSAQNTSSDLVRHYREELGPSRKPSVFTGSKDYIICQINALWWTNWINTSSVKHNIHRRNMKVRSHCYTIGNHTGPISHSRNHLYLSSPQGGSKPPAWGSKMLV